MKVTLEQGPEGSPNFCFGLYRQVNQWRRDEIMFIQSDWEWASLATTLGWIPCECGRSDGTVACQHKTVPEMLSEAFDYLAERSGQKFDVSDEYEPSIIYERLS